MAVTSGVRPCFYWLEVNGTRFAVAHGSAEQTATRRSAAFTAHLPLNEPGVLSTLANIGQNTASLIVEVSGASQALVTGEIDNIDFDLIEKEVVVDGRCLSAKLHANKSAEKWPNRKTSEIVQDLAGRVGLSVDASSAQMLAGKLWNQDWAKLSDGVSFAAIIHKLAELEGMRWWVKNGTLYFATSGQGAYVVNYFDPLTAPTQSDALRLTVRRNVQAAKTANVTVRSWHEKKAKVFTGKSSMSGAGGTVEYQFHIPGLLQDHADKYARSKAAEHARHELTVECELVGDPTLDVSQKLQLQGTGYFDQAYDIDEIRHSLKYGGGYTMSISAKSAKAGRSAA